jgi:hypothetical protein
MELSTEFERIEGFLFHSEVGIVGGFKPFLRIIGEHPTVQKLKEGASTKEGRDLILARVIWLFTQHSGAKLGNEFDVPLAVYMDVLYWKDHEAGRKAAGLIYPAAKDFGYWSYGISQAIIAREEKAAPQLRNNQEEPTIAYKFKINVTEKNEVTIQLPADFPRGEAEVILLHHPAAEAEERLKLLNAWISALPPAAPVSLDPLDHGDLYT